MIDAERIRFRPGQRAGHYESVFVRANHPTRPLAFWLRYTMFQPEGAPERAVGALWAIAFDGETGRHTAVRSEYPLADCAYGPEHAILRIGSAQFARGAATGTAGSGGQTLSWDLRWQSQSAPLPLLPAWLYDQPLPKAKSVVTQPLTWFAGQLVVADQTWLIANWPGSVNHNWGQRHTDEYVYGQVVGFAESPDTVLDCAAARIKLGPFWSPRLTLAALRHRGNTYLLNEIFQSIRNQSEFSAGQTLDWAITANHRDLRLRATFTAPRAAFVGLTYQNPPGGVKHCLNSKLAAVTLDLNFADGRRERLTSRSGGLFEIVPAEPTETYGIPLAI